MNAQGLRNAGPVSILQIKHNIYAYMIFAGHVHISNKKLLKKPILKKTYRRFIVVILFENTIQYHENNL